MVFDTPHALRHWFGTALRAAGVDSLVIKELMGHESLATTLRGGYAMAFGHR